MAGEGYQRRINSSQVEFHSSQPSHWHWNQIFATRRLLKLDDENIPYIHIGFNAHAQDNLIRYFMKDPDEPDGCVSQAEKAEKFCHGATLVALQNGYCNVEQRLVALVDDKAIEGGQVVDRGDQKALTARRLHQILTQPVK